MKQLVLIASFLLSFQAAATGSLDCFNEDQTFYISGTTARFYGNPLLYGLTVEREGQRFEIPRERIIGYWNMGPQVLVATIDADYIDEELYLEVKEEDEAPYQWVGQARFRGEEFTVSCELN